MNRIHLSRPPYPQTFVDASRLSATATASSATITVAIALATAFLEEAVVCGIGGHDEEEDEQDYTLNVHSINVTRNAASHAMAHWKTRIIIAHVLPSSRRIVAMAAMHGV